MTAMLAGIRIVEVAFFIAAPSAGLYLRQLGARVIRVDPPGGGPDFRRWPVSDNGASLYWEGLNKGKESVAIDFSKPEGRDLVTALATAPCEGCGIVLTNLPRHSFIDYAALTAKRPDLILVRIGGWADGRSAVDYTVNAAHGIPDLTGPVGSDAPVNHILPAWDLLAGSQAALAIAAAVRRRERTGEGAELTINLADTAAAALGNLGMVAEAFSPAGIRGRVGNDVFGTFGRDFITADSERIMVVAITKRQWRDLVNCLDLDDAVASLESELSVSFAVDDSLRFDYRGRLNPLLAEAIGKRTLAEISDGFTAKGVCWSRYGDLRSAVSDDMAMDGATDTVAPVFTDVTHPGGRYPTPGSVIRESASTGEPPLAAPSLGDHTDDVLRDVLSLDGDAIDRLRNEKIIG